MRCRIRIKGHLDLSWQEWMEELALVHDASGTTVRCGTLRDQAALYGVLLKIRRLTESIEGKEYIMATTDLEKLIEDWALAWSSPNTLEKLVSLFTDDCVYEDLPLGVLTHGKKELEQFYHLTRSGFPDFKIELTSRFVAGSRAGTKVKRCSDYFDMAAALRQLGFLPAS